MSHTSQNLGLTVLEQGDLADLTTVSDNFDAIDAVVGDIATVETSPTAAAHNKGEFLLYEGRLYKVTAAISAGASLILGTNIAAANIGAELRSLQNSRKNAAHFGPSSLATLYNPTFAYELFGMVFLEITAQVNSAITNPSIIGFIDSAYGPSETIYTPAMGTTGPGYIMSDGSIGIAPYSTIAAGSLVRVFAVYPKKNYS